VDKIFLSSKTSTNAYVFPLLYADNPDKGAQPAASTMPAVIQSNLAASFMALLREHLGYEPTDSPSADDVSAEEAFAYIYAILHSPAYRSRYRAHLRRDFPRIPLTRNPELYAAISALGKRLIGIHLLDITVPTFTAYPVDGSHRVETVVYGPPDESSTRGRISINETQYFEGIPPEVWDFHVGGWRTCEKWLKDRKGRQLTFNDLEHYQRIVAVLSETLRMMTEIDETVVAHGGWPIR